MTSAPLRDIAQLVARCVQHDADQHSPADLVVERVQLHETVGLLEIVASWMGHAPHTFTVDFRRES
jgi:hypothetical protein